MLEWADETLVASCKSRIGSVFAWNVLYNAAMPGEIKIVVFTDEVGSTAKVDIRTESQRAQVKQDRVKFTEELARKLDGKIHQDTGDGHMIYFSSPQSAILFGHLLQEQVKRRNEALENENLKFTLHIGAEAGELVEEIPNPVQNYASRVCSHCPAGEVYFTEMVAYLLRSNSSKMEIERVGNFPGKNADEQTLNIFRLVQWLDKEAIPAPKLPQIESPFGVRGGIRNPEAFFGREAEQKLLADYIAKGTSCQIVGERRIGKTSLLLQVSREAEFWKPGTVVAYVDLQAPHNFTMRGFLKSASRQLGFETDNLIGFYEGVINCLTNRYPVLCIDEFEEFTQRREEFIRDFFLTLRSIGQRGMSILTTSRVTLSDLTDKNDPTSPFYNTFARVPLGLFTEAEVREFLGMKRHGGLVFSEGEQEKIWEVCRCHPLALQVACHRVFVAKLGGEQVNREVWDAVREDMHAMSSK
jgi:uncharacterized protein